MAAGQSRMRGRLSSRLKIKGDVVLMYHGISASESTAENAAVDPRERKYWISTRQFAAQLAAIRDLGISVLALDELLVKADSPPALRAQRRVSITFDDGKVSDYVAVFPILAEERKPATFFLNTAYISRPGYLNWSQIGEMHRAGMSIQSHGHEHVYLTRLSAQALDIQLRISKQILEDRLGQPVDCLAAPYGDLNSQVIRVALSAGYRFICTSWNWPARAGAATVNRVAVYNTTSAHEFEKLLQGDLWCYTKRATRAALLHFPKRMRLRITPFPPSVPMSQEHA